MRNQEEGRAWREIVRGAARVVVAHDSVTLGTLAAEMFVTLAQRSAEEEGNRFAVAFSGGETPKRLYARISMRSIAAQVLWRRLYAFWGDERHVPPEDPRSNYRMVYETLLSQVPIPGENVYRIRAELPDANDAAREYEDTLRGFFNLQPDDLPRFDLALLGLGIDGHIASLFPGTEVLHDQQHLVAAPWVEVLKTHRITLTPRVFNNAETVLFLVSGAEKAAVLHAVLDGPYNPDLLPAQLIAPTHGTLIWLVDEAAATELRG